MGMNLYLAGPGAQDGAGRQSRIDCRGAVSSERSCLLSGSFSSSSKVLTYLYTGYFVPWLSPCHSEHRTKRSMLEGHLDL
jgi:hypothetical protein